MFAVAGARSACMQVLVTAAVPAHCISCSVPFSSPPAASAIGVSLLPPVGATTKR